MKTVLIAGAGGYLGTELTKYLLKKKYTVIALDRFFFGETLKNFSEYENLKIIKDDIRYFDIKILKKVNIVINLASLSNDPASDLNPKYTKQINYLGAKRLAKAAKKYKVNKYIFASSCSVYGSADGVLNEKSELAPVSEYAKSKINAEKALAKLANKNFKVTNLRLSTLFGVSENRMRFDLMVNIMTLHAWRDNKIFILGGGQQWRPLIHIQDAIEAFEKVIETNQNNNFETYNIGSNNQNYQTIQVANEIKKYFPNLIIEITPDDPDPRNYRVNFDKAKKDLKFKTKRNLDYGIKEVLKALENGNIEESIKTSTHNYYKYLIEADKILNFVKIKKKLL